MNDIVLFLDVPDSGAQAMYYEAARALALWPVLIDITLPDTGAHVSSDRLKMPRMDEETILSAIDRIGRGNIAGVFACDCHVAELAARLADKLDLPHADPDAISLSNDKLRLREFLEIEGLGNVAYRHVTAQTDIRVTISNLGGIVVVKPLFSTGSDGARVCQTSDEAVAHAERLLKRESAGVLVEQYIDAPQYTVEVFDGIPLNVARIRVSDGAFPIIFGVDLPARLDDERAAEIKNYAAFIAEKVGLAAGPAFVELRCSGTDMYVVEINPRPPLYSTSAQNIASGIDIASFCLKFACGLPYNREFSLKKDGSACAVRHVLRNGSSVRMIEGLDEARLVQGVESVHIQTQYFYRGGPATSSSDRIVSVYSKAQSIELAAASADRAIEKLSVIYDSYPTYLFKYHRRKVSILWRKLFDRIPIRKGSDVNLGE